MKFFGRKKELSVIQEELKLVGEQRSARMIVVTGRRRIGKTRLIEQSLMNSRIPTVQFIFYPYAIESVLVKEFLSEIGQKLGLNYLPACTTVVDVLAFLFDVAKTKPINIVIDECQEIDHVNPAFWGKLQALWDRNKRQCSLALFLCGSVASAMKHIFEDYSQPLFGRVDRIIQLAPFAPDGIKEILTDFNPQYTPDDLLALYVMTGGVAQYIEYLLERNALHLKEMVEVAVNPTSFFLNEGNIMLANEFRAEYGIYYLILQKMAQGVTKREELQNFISKSIGGYLAKLENFYGLIGRNEPLFSENAYKKSRFKMTDRYLMFWFAFLNDPQRIGARNFQSIKDNIFCHYETFSGRALEQYFLEKYKSESRYTHLGQWWDRRGDNEIDLIGVNVDKKWVDLFEVKRNAKKINLNNLYVKAEAFLNQNPKFREYQLNCQGLSLDDI